MLGIRRLEDYLAANGSQLERRLARPDAQSWEQFGQRRALATFHAAARRVPAYRDFLARRGVRPERVTTFREFREIPATDKANYVEQYPLEELVWDGDLSRTALMNTSSGTMGKSYLWPTSAHELVQSAALHELLYRCNLGITKKSTLLIVCFGMGTWIAGAHTTSASQHLCRKGYRFTTMTPGFNKRETLGILRSLAPRYEQTIIAGIPSFVKEVVDQHRADSINPGSLSFLLAGEGFTEEWRDHVLHSASSDGNSTNVVSLLGSADAGLMAFETQRSITLRRLAANDPKLCRDLFSGDRLPMLFNYVPTHRFFEDRDGELLITAARALPLVRYNMHDEGTVLSKDMIRGHVPAESEEHAKPFDNLPLVAVYGRGKFATTLYGANIYAEDVEGVLLEQTVAEKLTGRFVLETAYSRDQDQSLEVHVELAENVIGGDGLATRLAKVFVDRVRKTTSEYDRICREYGPRAAPVIVLHPYGRSRRFPTDVQTKSR